MPQGQSFIPMMMLLRELLANLNWTIQQKFGLHPTIATLSNLNHNLSNIEEWSICWTCSSITIRLTFFVSFGQYEHAFCVTKCVGLPTEALSGTQTSDILYYEVLDIPLPELQFLKTLKVAFHHPTKDEVCFATRHIWCTA